MMFVMSEATSATATFLFTETTRTLPYSDVLLPRSNDDGSNSANADVVHANRSNGFLNRVRWFDSGRGDDANPFSKPRTLGRYVTGSAEQDAAYSPPTSRRRKTRKEAASGTAMKIAETQSARMIGVQ
jgi:hypothetical protein